MFIVFELSKPVVLASIILHGAVSAEMTLRKDCRKLLKWQNIISQAITIHNRNRNAK